mmetsp:Transcript_13721/g.38336  ORF Transcript_13721/g.38336 Transcript_13721/m.38336 type:complete len:299 (-) Transcript_13721:243-1139(-)
MRRTPGSRKTRRMVRMIVQAPQQLLDSSVRDVVVGQPQLPQRLGAMPQVPRERSHRSIGQTIAGNHHALRGHLQASQDFEELVRPGIVQARATHVQQLQASLATVLGRVRSSRMPDLIQQAVHPILQGSPGDGRCSDLGMLTLSGGRLLRRRRRGSTRGRWRPSRRSRGRRGVLRVALGLRMARWRLRLTRLPVARRRCGATSCTWWHSRSSAGQASHRRHTGRGAWHASRRGAPAGWATRGSTPAGRVAWGSPIAGRRRRTEAGRTVSVAGRRRPAHVWAVARRRPISRRGAIPRRA